MVETARRIQRERREEQTRRDHVAKLKAQQNKDEWKPEVIPNLLSQSPRAATSMSRASIPSIPASRASFSSVQSIRTKSLLVKIRTDVSERIVIVNTRVFVNSLLGTTQLNSSLLARNLEMDLNLMKCVTSLFCILY